MTETDDLAIARRALEALNLADDGAIADVYADQFEYSTYSGDTFEARVDELQEAARILRESAPDAYYFIGAAEPVGSPEAGVREVLVNWSVGDKVEGRTVLRIADNKVIGYQTTHKIGDIVNGVGSELAGDTTAENRIVH
jgi:hypothetical protein